MRQKTNTLIFPLLLTVVLVAASCGALESGPASVMEKFARHVEAGESTEAMALMSGDIVDKLGTDKMRQVLAAQTSEIQKKGGIASIEIENEQVTGEVAEVTAVVTYGDGTTKRDTTKLAKVDGEWKISLSK